MPHYWSKTEQPQYARVTVEFRTIRQEDLEAVAEFLGYASLAEYVKETFMTRAIADLDRLIAQPNADHDQAVVRKVEEMLVGHTWNGW